MAERTLIAVVDDEPTWLATMGRALAREGYHAQLIGDGEAAVDLIVAERPLVAVLDRHMPRISGLELSARLRARLGESCPPLVLVTGDLNELSEPELDRFDAAYEKPVPLALLMRTVRRLVRGQKSSGTIAAVAEEAADGPPVDEQQTG